MPIRCTDEDNNVSIGYSGRKSSRLEIEIWEFQPTFSGERAEDRIKKKNRRKFWTDLLLYKGKVPLFFFFSSLEVINDWENKLIWILVVKIFNTISKIPHTYVRFRAMKFLWSSPILRGLQPIWQGLDNPLHTPEIRREASTQQPLSLALSTTFSLVASRKGKELIFSLPPCLLLGVKVLSTFSWYIVSFMKLYLAVCFLEDMNALEANY